jgi:hypothetical protein
MNIILALAGPSPGTEFVRPECNGHFEHVRTSFATTSRLSATGYLLVQGDRDLSQEVGESSHSIRLSERKAEYSPLSPGIVPEK